MSQAFAGLGHLPSRYHRTIIEKGARRLLLVAFGDDSANGNLKFRPQLA
jgi:hypothetical protein